MAKNVTRSEEPQTRLERLCAAMAEALEAHPEYRDGDDKAIIMLSGPGEDGTPRGGMATHGYEPDESADAMADLLSRVEALFQANGLKFTFVPAPNPGEG